MFDALAPACDALDAGPGRRGRPRGGARPRGGRRRRGRDATIPMLARKGRASYLGERSVGPPGPGRDVVRAAGRHGGAGAGRRRGVRRRAMTGLVVVSHSRALAEAAVALAAEMLHGSSVRISIAAGLDATTFGTDAMDIVDAIGAADDGAGVVVLMDLGSAVLSAELALDTGRPDVRERVVLCPAPLVEGLVVAAVAAAGGAAPAEVAAEAAGSLAAKQAHVGAPVDETGGAVAESGADADEALAVVVTIANPHGLHARPPPAWSRRRGSTTRGSGCATSTPAPAPCPRPACRGWRRSVRSAVTRSRSARPAARPARPSTTWSPSPRRFDEAPGDEAPVAAAPSLASGHCPPRRASRSARPSRCSPRTWRCPTRPRVTRTPSGGACARRIADVRRQIQLVRATTARDVGEGEAGIFDAHLLLLDDPDLVDTVARPHPRRRRGRPGLGRRGLARSRPTWPALPDPYLRARAADVRAVGEQVARGAGRRRRPSQVGRRRRPRRRRPHARPGGRARPRAGARAACWPPAAPPRTARSSPARAASRPWSCAGAGVLAVTDGVTVVARRRHRRGRASTPTRFVLDRPAGRRRARPVRRGARPGRGRRPAVTRDGRPSWSAPTSARCDDARAAAGRGADLAGLVRTEFLFLDRHDAPSVDEQVATYGAIAEALGGRRLTLRTLDVGGDKPLPYAAEPAEANPFLGLRGLRLALARPGPAARPARGDRRGRPTQTPVSVMFPMVTAVDELVAARALLDEAVEADGRGWPAGLRGRDHGRGAGRGAQGRGVRAPRRLLQHRHQRPHPVRAGRRARQRRPSPGWPTRSTPPCCGWSTPCAAAAGDRIGRRVRRARRRRGRRPGCCSASGCAS